MRLKIGMGMAAINIAFKCKRESGGYNRNYTRHHPYCSLMLSNKQEKEKSMNQDAGLTTS